MKKLLTWFLIAFVLLSIVFAGSVAAGRDPFFGKIAEPAATSPCPETTREREVLHNAVVRIRVHWKSQDAKDLGPYSGLGFIVEGKYVFTAEHVVKNYEGFEREIFLERLPLSSSKPPVLVRAVLFESPEIDFALLELPQGFLDRYTAESYSLAEQKEILRGTESCFYQRPQHSKLQQSTQGVITRWSPPRGTWAWFGIAIEPTVFELLPGASGGPVFIRTSRGLVVAGITKSIQRESNGMVTQIRAVDATYAAHDIKAKTGIDISAGP